MAPASYAVWVLALQATAYLGYLDFGLQTAIGRYVALANANNDTKLRDGIFSTAFAGLSIAALLGFFVILAIALAAGSIFPAIPQQLLPALRMTMLIVGASLAIGLPASAWNGVFVGLQRYDIPAFTVGTGRLFSAIGLILASITGRSLVFMAVVMGATNLYSYALQFAILQRIAPDIRFRRELITVPIIKELSGYCVSLTVWSFAMLLIGGLDVFLVGRFDFPAVIPYAVSATLITFLAGVQNSIFGVIMPHATVLYANHDSRALGDLLIKTTKFGVLLLLLTGLPLIVFAAPIIGAWIGPQFAHVGGRILTILVIANVLRLTGTPYASILIGTGQQRLVIVAPLLEGVTNLFASVMLGMRFGAIGVAMGTLIGAVIAVSTNLFYSLPRTRSSIDVSMLGYLCKGLTAPALCGIPVVLALLATTLGKSCASATVIPSLLISFGACAILIYQGTFKKSLAAWVQ